MKTSDEGLTVTRLRFFLVMLCASLIWSRASAMAQAPAPLTDAQRVALERKAKEQRSHLEPLSKQSSSEWSDAAIFSKGLDWALRYDRDFTAADVEQMERAVRRGQQRLDAINQGRHPWTIRHGKIALGYRSVVDGSVQPYGVVVPKSYDGKTPIRLDVVLHGSSRPVGISELRFIARFDEGDDETASPPDQPFIELHPLGRVENCYRWSGETDVFEAIEDVCRRYQIDRTRIVLRGMSMGASGTWHLGLKHPDRFIALGPYCGYVDTHKFSQTPIPGFVVVGPLPEHQEQGLHMLDSVDYAANAGVVPAIACIGGKDVFFQAHVIMHEAMAREGLTMTNLISPDTGHVIDPVTQTEQLRQIAEHAAVGYQARGKLRFVTWTLKYGRCHWLQILGLKQHYARAEFSARMENDVLIIDEPLNISKFAIDVAKLPAFPKSVRIGGIELPVKLLPSNQPQSMVIASRDGRWQWDESPLSRTVKRPGVQGPIDDAFATPFLCVRGTGQAWNQAAGSYADASLKRFADEWHHYFRGELPIKNDIDVTAEDWESKNLILFGDPGSNSLITRVLSDLPLKWTRESLQFAGMTYPASDHLPALIAPNPLPGADNRYVVLNSGHTFRESDLAKFNYLLFPRWGDWAVLKLDSTQSFDRGWDDNVVKAGYFDESWGISAKSPQ
ncbi:prolyl oligopeptidase family serine peptidase [Schlesneria paludicola]|uniref:prolyl oligopeptidase family serine peptidase n=1 Tax=Schlesneria paludicola TaxID=360056 RepID=UPI000299E6BE|nr:prolyl oligopeptidase family serine peptidase [Schlesneria paludicola]